MVAWGDMDDEQLAAAVREMLHAELDAIPVGPGLRAIRAGTAAFFDRRVLVCVRAGPGRTPYAIARELGLFYPAARNHGRHGPRVKFDKVLASLERLQAAGRVRLDDSGPHQAWYPDGEQW